MERIKNWIEEKAFWLKTGSRLKIVNNGKSVDEVIIRYKDFYFSIMLDSESGEPTGDFGWSNSPMMTHIPVREFYIAERSNK